MNFAEVKAITITEGDVKSISIGGQIVWQKVSGVYTTKTASETMSRTTYLASPVDTGIQLLAGETYTIDYDMTCSHFSMGMYSCSLTLFVIGDDVNTVVIGNTSSYSTEASGTVEYTPSITGNLGIFGQYFGNGGTVNLTITGLFAE